MTPHTIFTPRNPLSVMLLVVGLMLCGNVAFSQTAYTPDYIEVDTTWVAPTDTEKMVNSVASTVGGVTTLIMGPGIWLVMAIGCLMALYGFGRGQKEALFTGIGLFIFAAIIRGIFSLIM